MMEPTFLLELLALFLTISVLLYLVVGDNALFRVVVYAFIGVTAGYGAALVLFQVLIPRLATLAFTGEPLLVGLALLHLLLGGLLFFKLWRRTAFLGSFPMAILAGVGAAVVIGGAVFGTLFQQIGATVNLFDLSLGSNPLARLMEGGFVLLGTISVLAYFQYSLPGRAADAARSAGRPAVVELLGTIGKVFIGITLGAMFAGVYTAALTALVERTGFVYEIVARLLQ